MELTKEEKSEESGSAPAPSMDGQPGITKSKKGRQLTDEAITKMKVDYVHTLLKIIERQDFQVYAVKIGRLMEIDRVFKENGLRTTITVSTEPFAEHLFQEKELRHLKDFLKE